MTSNIPLITEPKGLRTMPCLSECTDMTLWRAGIVSLRDLATGSHVMPPIETLIAFRGNRSIDGVRRYHHDFGPIVEEDGEFYRLCSRCHRVAFNTYIPVDGVEVSRVPQSDASRCPLHGANVAAGFVQFA